MSHRTTHRFALALSTVFLLPAPLAATTTFTAVLNGHQCVPPVATGGYGDATFTLSDDMTELVYHIEFGNMTGTEFAAHIHNAPPGKNGPAELALPVGSPKDGTWQIPANMVTELMAGRLYVNIHTDVYVGGELRGNIMQAATPVEETTLGAVKKKYAGR
jgi:hypothetical protein